MQKQRTIRAIAIPRSEYQNRRLIPSTGDPLARLPKYAMDEEIFECREKAIVRRIKFAAYLRGLGRSVKEPEL